MANTIQLRLLDNKTIVASMQGIPLANENSYRIIAGEQNATNFAILQKPTQYADYTYYVEMVNSQGYGIAKTMITETITIDGSSYPKFNLPVGMAVAGYGYISITAESGVGESLQVIKFIPIKVKVWNTIPKWKEAVSAVDSYDLLVGAPIINQDLGVLGFIPATNTYYRHTGETTSNFIQGKIYFYDGSYKAIDGSGSGGSTIEVVQATGTSTTAVMSQDATTKEFDKKLDKASYATSYHMLYGKLANGNQTLFTIDYTGSSGNSIVARDSDGGVVVATPTSDTKAANRKYVDDAIASAITTTLNTAV